MNTINSIEDFFFPIKKSSVYYVDNNGMLNKIDNKRSILTDDDKYISVVSDNYHLIKNKDIIEPLVETFDKIGIKYTIDNIHSYCKPNKMNLRLILPDIEFDEKIEGDDGKSKYNFSLSLHNSYDGSTSVRVLWSLYRLICKNGAMINKILNSFRIKHTKYADIEKIKMEMDRVYSKIPQIQEKFEELSNIKVNAEFMKIILNELGKRLYEKINGDALLLSNTFNRLQLFNLLTQYVSHNIKQDRMLHYQNKISNIFVM